MEGLFDTIIFGIIINFILLLGYYFIAQKLKILDKPNERSSHFSNTIRGAGIVLLFVNALLLYFSSKNNLSYTNILTALSIGIITGFIDDKLSLKPLLRAFLYAFSIIMVMRYFNNHFSFESLYSTLIQLSVFVIFIGTVNTYNFMDGINGITLIYSILFLSTCSYLVYIKDLELYSEIYLLFGLYTSFFISFIFFNYRNKALMFLGDSGSVAMGIMACFGVSLVSTIGFGWTAILLLGTYGVDSVGTIIIRLINKENIFTAHKSHLYQDLVHYKKIGHLRVSLIYGFIQLIINISLIIAFNQNILTICSILIIVLLAILYTLLKLNIRKGGLFVKR